MKRRLFGCVALWMLAATAMAQNPVDGTTSRKAPGRTTTTPRPAARAALTPASETQQAPIVQAPEAPSSLVQMPSEPVITPEAMTPELYLYLQQQKRHDDPMQAVRRKAEFKAAQRMNRMATMKWFGMSNARPQVAAVPMMGVYSPAWVGNGYDRYDWVGGVYPSATVYIENETVQR